MGKRLVIILLTLMAFYSPSDAKTLPEGMSFIGLTDKGWQAFVVNSDGLHRPIVTLENPREFTWHKDSQKMAYVSSSGEVYLGREQQFRQIVSTQDRDAFAQIKLVEGGNRLIGIRLIEKKSEMTTLASWNDKAKRFVDTHSQYGKIFDPTYIDGRHYFTVVSCMLECGGIVQELWVKDSFGSASQQTIHNGIVRYPFAVKGSDRAVYSLNKIGQYKLWQRENGQFRQLTFGMGSDVNPIVTPLGEIIFVKKNQQGSRLYKLTEEGEKEVILEGVTEIRNMELNL